jgi:hypothetical protein
VRRIPEIERHFDRTTVGLARERAKRLAPIVEIKRVGQHSREIDRAVGDHIEVMLDTVLSFAARL